MAHHTKENKKILDKICPVFWKFGYNRRLFFNQKRLDYTFFSVTPTAIK